MDSESAVLQPFALVEGNLNGQEGINDYVRKIRNTRSEIITKHQKDIQSLEHSVEKKYDDEFITIQLPGSSKKIKIKAKSFFNKMDKNELDNIRRLKFLDFTRMKVVQENSQNATLIDKDFQKSFLKK